MFSTSILNIGPSCRVTADIVELRPLCLFIASPETVLTWLLIALKMLDGTTIKEILTKNGKKSTQVFRLLRGPAYC